MNTIQKLIAPAIGIIGILLVMTIVFSCQLVNDGKEMKKIDEQIVTLQNEQTEISEKIASASSLTTVREKATAMGFVPSKSVMTIRADQFTVALNTK